jgi:hypothetical protein
MSEQTTQNYTTIMSSNIGAITPAKFWRARSDSIFSQFNSERVKELATSSNTIALTDVKIIPFLVR